MRLCRLVMVFAVICLLVSPSFTQAAPSVLVYDDNTAHQRAQNAITSLGIAYTRATGSTFSGLLTSQSWDLVVVDCPSNTPGDWLPLINYVQGGGRALMSFWDLDNDTGYGNPALPGAFDVSVSASFGTPQTVYLWSSSHPVFQAPNAIGNLTSWTDEWADDGDRLALVPLRGASALAGYTATATEGQAAIVLGNSGRTIYNGFLWDELNDPAGRSLIANEAAFLLGSVPEPSSILSLLCGLGGLGSLMWRRARKTA
ncbi:MAG: PEP-CTERM sorting domain-containing protein [Armatimonadota bacterium]|nr:PEP-CTERM sorting domain-containing protein [Armatimonadota bacterium]